MNISKFTFKNSGDRVNNDVIYPGVPFELANQTHSFKINPKSKFWRFGLRLSTSNNIEFDANKPRHINTNFPDIHIGVGIPPTLWNWEHPNLFHLAQYHLKNYDHLLYRSDSYIQLGEVEWTIQHDITKNILNMSCKAEGADPFDSYIELNGQFKYFHLFAWADKIQFELECEIRISTPNSDDDTAPTKSSKTGKFSVLSKPTKNLIGSEEIAVIYKDIIINSQKSDEQFFAIFGKWGRGKTHFWDLLKKSFTPEDKFKFHLIEFQAWKYQDTPAIWAYLYDTFQKKYIRKPENYRLKDWANYYQNIIALNLKRKYLYPIVNLVAFFLLSILGCMLLREFESQKPLINWFINHSKGSAAVLTPFTLYYFYVYLKKYYSTDAKKILSNLTKGVSFESHLGLQHEIQKELILLLKTWIPNPEKSKERVLLFIDDIDRCSEDKIIQIVDYIRILLHHPEIQKRLSVVAAIDERILLSVIKNKYEKITDRSTNDYSHFCREYIDKLFIASLKLGPLTPQEKKELILGFSDHDTIKIQDNSLRHIATTSTKVSMNPVNIKVSPSGTETIRVTVDRIDEDIFIADWEKEILFDCINLSVNITPRGVRILTVRYLLGKRLIESALSENMEESQIWYESKDIKKYFALQLVRFSFIESIVELEKAYQNHISSTKSTLTCQENIMGESFNLNTNLTTNIYQTLIMIVTY